LNSSGDQINTDPILGPLQDNGGRTFTIKLLTGSPAIDAGTQTSLHRPYMISAASVNESNGHRHRLIRAAASTADTWEGH
jgi:hypothetical protein